ncbi:hypothetical protein BB559_001133, partial [Furculomyces boomerangus]
MIDAAGIASYVFWKNLHPNWKRNQQNMRFYFLESIAKSLIFPHAIRRKPIGIQKSISMTVVDTIVSCNNPEYTQTTSQTHSELAKREELRSKPAAS